MLFSSPWWLVHFKAVWPSLILSKGFQATSGASYSALVDDLSLYGAIETNSTLKIYLSPLTEYSFVNGNVLSINYLITKIN